MSFITDALNAAHFCWSWHDNIVTRLTPRACPHTIKVFMVDLDTSPAISVVVTTRDRKTNVFVTGTSQGLLSQGRKVPWIN